jgi:hypothetical protein
VIGQDGEITVTGGHIWDMPINGLYTFLGSIVDELPEHEPNPLFTQAVLMLGTFFRLSSVFVASILNLQLALGVIAFIAISESVYWLLVVVRLIYKFIPAAA